MSATMAQCAGREPLGAPPRLTAGEEGRATLRLALPMALTQFAQLSIQTTEIILIGWLGTRDLAAASLGVSLYHPFMLFIIGLASAAAPLVAQARGARRPREVRRAVRQGLWASGLVSLLFMILLWHGGALLGAVGQAPELIGPAERYLRALLWGLPFAGFFIVLRSFTGAFGHTRAFLVITLLAVPFNALLSWVLIFGPLGFPALGLVGGAIGASVTQALMFLVLLVWTLRHRAFRRFAILGRFWRPDWKCFATVMRVGLPIGAAMLMESGLFAASTQLMGLVGAVQLAAHQVTLQITASAFMIPLGISQAATIRVGLAAGRGNAEGVLLAGRVAIAFGTVFSLATAIFFWLMPQPLAGLFLGAAEDGSRAILLAAAFLQVAAVFQLVDCWQVIGIANLRGLRDTAVPMWIAIGGYWGLGFPTCLFLGLHTPLGGTGIWWGLAVALAAVAIAMVVRFERMAGRMARG
ncbi:MATE family efflux transporter [Geminicoccaceae bacterium 1502E]|nr:MATE family efflux transporter [Geminicoccaceae bacterium 1502E]